MSPGDDDRSPVDELVDLFVYAPLGLALTLRDSLPGLVEKGKQQFESQTALAKMMGEYAVKEARKRFTPPAAPAPTPARRAPASPAEPSTNGQAAPAAAPPAPPSPPPPSDHLAIPGYDTLSASQVVQRLAGLSPAELDAVRAYEEATRGRRTILSKVSQLQAS